MRLSVDPGLPGAWVRLFAETNYTYRIEASTALGTWTTWATTNATTVTNGFLDAAAAPTRHYRAVLLP